ncbi:hypothetical protein ETB97_012671 [Aspergillus alliaceus]|uniref:GPR1/FUN34/yaaH family-domain-containing protein n=1 Tax=Petromyces alliaceus TaxID=209559 RepID=A0A8H6E6X2_PETAA|nr:hypothetical protein ETB97_012671 [Aspergillus burnettii]
MSSGDISEKHDIDTLRPVRTAESVFLPISRDAFEKLYLSPKHPSVKGDLRKQVGNPTPISLIGFLVSATPHAFITMGIRGSGESGAAMLPAFIFFGGLIQILGGTFWIVHGTGLMPIFATGLHYSSTGDALEGMQTPSYHATLGFYYVALAMISFVYTICSIRTNICLFTALFLLVIGFSLFAATYFQLALGEATLAARLQYTAGGFTLALVIPIWHIFIAQMLEAVDFPIAIPVGDLSTVILGRSQKAQMRTEE